MERDYLKREGDNNTFSFTKKRMKKNLGSLFDYLFEKRLLQGMAIGHSLPIFAGRRRNSYAVASFLQSASCVAAKNYKRLLFQFIARWLQQRSSRRYRRYRSIERLPTITEDSFVFFFFL